MLMLQNGFAMVEATSQYVNSNLILFLIVVILYNKEMSDQMRYSVVSLANIRYQHHLIELNTLGYMLHH